MKKILLALQYLIFSVSIFAQNSLSFSKIDTAYTWRNSTQAKMDSVYYGLPMVQYSPFKIHVRVLLDRQVLDLYSKDEILFAGILTNITTEYTTEKTKKNEDQKSSVAFQKISQKILIDTGISTQIAQHILQSGQLNVPDSLLNKWQRGFLHCSGILYYYRSGDNYKTQFFSCPWSQNDSIPYRSTIVDNYNFIKQKIKLDTLYQQFENALPKGITYSYDGYMFSYMQTDKQSKRSAKYIPQWQYWASIEDTLTHDLKNKLQKIFGSLDKSCRNSFFIKFSTSGKITRVTRKTKISKKWDWDDYEFACKSEIHKQLRTLRIDYLCPPKTLWLEIMFFEDEISISSRYPTLNP